MVNNADAPFSQVLFPNHLPSKKKNGTKTSISLSPTDIVSLYMYTNNTPPHQLNLQHEENISNDIFVPPPSQSSKAKPTLKPNARHASVLRHGVDIIRSAQSNAAPKSPETPSPLPIPSPHPSLRVRVPIHPQQRLVYLVELVLPLSPVIAVSLLSILVAVA